MVTFSWGGGRGFFGCRRWRPPCCDCECQTPTWPTWSHHVATVCLTFLLTSSSSSQALEEERKAGGQRTSRSGVLPLFMQREGWESRSWTARLLHSVLLNGGSSWVSGVLLVMITDMSRSGRTGSPCDKNGTREAGALCSEGWLLKEISL